MSEDQKRVRLPFDFLPSDVEALERLCQKQNIRNKAGVIRQALSLYEAYTDAQERGEETIFRKPLRGLWRWLHRWFGPTELTVGVFTKPEPDQ